MISVLLRFMESSVGSYMTLLLRVLVGGVFVWSGIVKIAEPDSFIRSLMVYQLFPVAWSGVAVGLIAGILPWIEVGAGAALLLGYKPRTAALILAGLLCVFSGVLLVTVTRGIDIACGCFGSQNDPISWWHFVRNGGLFVSALCIMMQRKHRWTIMSLLERYLHPSP